MSFPTSPTDGQTATVNGVLYTYTAAARSWTRFTSGAGTSPVVYSGNVSYSNLSVTGNLTYANLVSGGVSRNAISYTATAGTPPATPIIGDQWYDTNTDSLYTYFTDGTSSFWLDISDRPNFVKFTTSSTAPTNPNVGDQWYDSSTDSLFTRISDGTSSYWVDLLSNKGSIIYTAGTSPNTTRPGDQWYDTATDTLYTRVTDGTSSYWVDYSSARQGIVNGNSNISILPNANISFYSGGINSLTVANTGITVPGNTNVNNLTVSGIFNIPNQFAPSSLITTQILENVSLPGFAPGINNNIDVNTASVWYFTSSSIVGAPNIRASSTVPLNSQMQIGQSLSVAIILYAGQTYSYISALNIDGVAQTILWQNGVAPSSATRFNTDVYNFVIVKTANATYTVFGSRTSFF